MLIYNPYIVIRMLSRKVMLYMSKEEYALISDRARKLGISTSRFMVLSAVGKIKNFDVEPMAETN